MGLFIKKEAQSRRMRKEKTLSYLIEDLSDKRFEALVEVFKAKLRDEIDCDSSVYDTLNRVVDFRSYNNEDLVTFSCPFVVTTGELRAMILGEDA